MRKKKSAGIAKGKVQTPRHGDLSGYIAVRAGDFKKVEMVRFEHGYMLTTHANISGKTRRSTGVQSKQHEMILRMLFELEAVDKQLGWKTTALTFV
jgi:hypothetical protein